MWPQHPKICAQTLVHKYRIVLRKSRVFLMSNFFNSFFALSTFWQSFRRENFTIILSLFLLLRWQALILFPSIRQPTLSNIFKTFSSTSPSLTLWGEPTSSKHSHLQYCAFAQHWRSMEKSLLDSTEFTCLVTVSSDWNYSKFSLNLRIWSIISLLAASLSICFYRTIEIRFFFSSLSEVSSVFFDIIEIFISYRRLVIKVVKTKP